MEERVCEIINSLGVKAELHNVMKNGIAITGICLGDGIVKPTLYVDSFEGSEQEIARKMIELYNNSINEGSRYSDMMNDFSDWEWAKGRVVDCLMKGNESGIVSRPFLDMTLYYRVLIDEEASFKVVDSVLTAWKVSEQELYDTAMENVADTVTATDMRTVIEGIRSDLDFDYDGIPSMIVLSNKRGVHGAIAMATEIVGRIAERFDSDLYIIPSSVHECILLPVEGVSANELTEMIMSVNSTQVAKTDQLADHAYIYKRSVGTVECA